MNDRTAVIILNYFGHEDTAACAASVQRHVPGAVCCIVDNSASAAERSCLQKLFGARDDVFLIFPSENLGFAAGVNRGLQAALEKGFSRFLLLNNDAVMLAGSGEILEAACAQHPGALIAPSIRWAGQICAGNYYHRYFGLILRKRPKRASGWLFYLTGCALLFDKVFLERNGLFSEAFFMYGEDVEFSARACFNAVPVLCLPDIIIDHAGSGSSHMASFFYEYHVARSHYLLTFFMFDKKPQQLLVLAIKMLSLLARALLRCVRFRTVTPLKALCCAPFKLLVRPS